MLHQHKDVNNYRIKTVFIVSARTFLNSVACIYIQHPAMLHYYYRSVSYVFLRGMLLPATRNVLMYFFTNYLRLSQTTWRGYIRPTFSGLSRE